MKMKSEDKTARAEIFITCNDLVSFLRRSGDLLRGKSSLNDSDSKRKIIGKISKGEGECYYPYASLSLRTTVEGTAFSVSSICDGVLYKDDEYIVDKIVILKHSEPPDEEFALDVAKSDAYILCESKKLDKIKVRLCLSSYKNDIQYKLYSFTKEELAYFFHGLIMAYLPFAKLRQFKNPFVEFPFKPLRAGQKTLITKVYSAIKNSERLFVNAPTGIGKTHAVLYPALKAIENNIIEKIFYISPKNTLQEQAAKAVMQFQKKPWLKTIILTAKAKLCPLGFEECEARGCAYAEGFFDRVNEAVLELLKEHDFITAEEILKVSQKYTLCPFELSLEAIRFCDVIICDYNYVFNPVISLNKYINNRACLLTDEAHNLPDRVREAYTASITPEDFEFLLSSSFFEAHQIKKASDDILNCFAENKLRVKISKEYLSFEKSEKIALLIKELIPKLIFALGDGFGPMTAKLQKQVTQLYRKCRNFLFCHGIFDERYVEITAPNGGVKLYLVDPSEKVREICGKFKSSVLFSATLLPKQYFFEMLGGEDEEFIEIQSPFDPDNFLVMTADVDATYSQRAGFLNVLSGIIRTAVSSRNGNYMVFFPSFEYMRAAAEDYKSRFSDDIILIQENYMSGEKRNAFIGEFKKSHNKSLIGFAVIGGIFAEGIDLTGDMLLGAIIVGVGLPPPSLESEAVLKRFCERELDGKAFAYTLPGFNRVLQAAGRVIRSENDRGFLILCDKRYSNEEYLSFLPGGWNEVVRIKSENHLKKILHDFWG